MKNGMVIIDADGHAVDAEPVYRERLPARYRKRNFILSSDGFDRGQIRTALNNAGFEAVFPGEQANGIAPLPPEVLKTLDIVAYPGTTKLDINSILATGKVTIVDFYADWCGPCHVLEARLQHLMQGKGNLALRRVNIGKWDNAAARQATRDFHAEALPYIRVYDAKGNFVTAVTGGMWDEVLAAIAKAERG